MIRKHSPGTRATEKFSVTRRQQQLASLLCGLTTSSNARPRTAAKQYRSLAPAARNKHAPSPQRNATSRPPPDPQPPQHSSADRGRAGTRQKSSQKALADGTGDGSAPERQPASARPSGAAGASRPALGAGARADGAGPPAPLTCAPLADTGRQHWLGGEEARGEEGREEAERGEEPLLEKVPAAAAASWRGGNRGVSAWLRGKRDNVG